jgi:hypothetical protein
LPTYPGYEGRNIKKNAGKCPSAQKPKSHTKTTDHDEKQIIGQAVLVVAWRQWLVTAYIITANYRHYTKTDAAFGWTKETASSDGDTAKRNHQNEYCRE